MARSSRSRNPRSHEVKAKVGRGSGFRGVLEYALGHDDARIVAGTMAGRDARELAAEFGAVRERRPDVERPVWHTSLAAAPGEHLTDDQWQALAEGFMKKMGFPEPTPFVVIRHASGEEQQTEVGKGPTAEHVHIIASRISLAGELWHGEWEVKTAINATQELEREHGLAQTNGLGPRAAAKRAAKPEIEQAARLSVEAGHEVKPARVELQEKVAAAVAGAPTIREFVDRLHADGVNVRPNLASTGKMNGFSFELDGVAMKGSDLGKAFTFGGLQKAGLDYDAARDTSFLASLTTKPLNAQRASAAHAAPKLAIKKEPPPEVLQLPRAPARGFRPAGPSLWARIGKRKKGELTPQQVEQIKVMADRLAHMLVKLVCRAFGVDYQTPHERLQLERGRRSAELAKQAIGNPPAEPRRDEELHDDREADRRLDHREHEDRHDEAKRAIAKRGLSRSSALECLAERGDVRGIERMLDEGAHVKGKALDAAAKGGHDEAFKKLVGGRTPMDSSDLKELARECQSAEAKAKLQELISQNKAGASFEKLGIDGPKAPPSMSGPSRGPSMSGPSMGGRR